MRRACCAGLMHWRGVAWRGVAWRGVAWVGERAGLQQSVQPDGPLPPLAEDLHHFDTASWRLLTHAVTDPALRETVLFVLTYRWGRRAQVQGAEPVAGDLLGCEALGASVCSCVRLFHPRSAPLAPLRPHFGALAPVLRQRGGSRELLYHRVQAAYRALLAQVRGGEGRAGAQWLERRPPCGLGGQPLAAGPPSLSIPFSFLPAQPSTLHLRLQPFDLEQSRRFVSASLGDAHVRGGLRAGLCAAQGKAAWPLQASCRPALSPAAPSPLSPTPPTPTPHLHPARCRPRWRPCCGSAPAACPPSWSSSSSSCSPLSTTSCPSPRWHMLPAPAPAAAPAPLAWGSAWRCRRRRRRGWARGATRRRRWRRWRTRACSSSPTTCPSPPSSRVGGRA